MDEINELLRSALSIAMRRGAHTNWIAFENNVRKELLRQAGVIDEPDEQSVLRATVTPLSYRMMPEDYKAMYENDKE